MSAESPVARAQADIDRRGRPLLLLAVAIALGMGTGGALLYAAPGSGIPFTALQSMLIAGSALPLGLLVTWYQPSNRFGAILVADGLAFGVFLLASATIHAAGSGQPIDPGFVQLMYVALTLGYPLTVIPWVAFVLFFPDGRFPGRAWRGIFAIDVAVTALVGVALWMTGGGSELARFFGISVPAGMAAPLASIGAGPAVAGLAQLLAVVLPPSAFIGLAGRYRRANQLVRQQIKWLVIAVGLNLVLQVLVPISEPTTEMHRIGQVALLAVGPLTFGAVGLAIFRYRLWELDLVVSRALVFGVLWVLASAVFLMVAAAAGVALSGGDPRVVAAVVLALGLTVALDPIRRRLERTLTRQVYGDRPGAFEVLADLARLLRAPAPVGELGDSVAEVVRRALGVSWAGIWLVIESTGQQAVRLIGSAGDLEVPPTLVLPDGVDRDLVRLAGPVLGAALPATLGSAIRPLWPEVPGAIAPLMSGSTLVGIMAAGPRPGEPLTPSDVDLLGLIADDSTLALRNLRLEAELRQHLEEIESQAEELRRSRERVITAQDEERRRIERDLHDGVQQQLVALAAKLTQRAAQARRPADRHTQEQLAREAEDAVFALQELGRGIYPSVLADQGLPAALRTQAARMPMAVSIEIEPGLVGRRFDPRFEAVLYYVGLEALTNVQKHAPGAQASLVVRTGGDGRALVLEVHDDGPGFDSAEASSGAGRQNMSDRLAAVGGRLAIESRRGSGTWVLAEVPIAMEPVAITRRLRTRAGR